MLPDQSYNGIAYEVKLLVLRVGMVAPTFLVGVFIGQVILQNETMNNRL